MVPKAIIFEINSANSLTGEYITYKNMTFEKAYKKLKKDVGIDFNIWNVEVKY